MSSSSSSNSPVKPGPTYQRRAIKSSDNDEDNNHPTQGEGWPHQRDAHTQNPIVSSTSVSSSSPSSPASSCSDSDSSPGPASPSGRNGSEIVCDPALPSPKSDHLSPSRGGSPGTLAESETEGGANSSPTKTAHSGPIQAAMSASGVIEAPENVAGYTTPLSYNPHTTEPAQEKQPQSQLQNSHFEPIRPTPQYLPPQHQYQCYRCDWLQFALDGVQRENYQKDIVINNLQHHLQDALDIIKQQNNNNSNNNKNSSNSNPTHTEGEAAHAYQLPIAPVPAPPPESPMDSPVDGNQTMPPPLPSSSKTTQLRYQCVLCGKTMKANICRHFKRVHPSYANADGDIKTHPYFPRYFYFFTKEARDVCPPGNRPPRRMVEGVEGVSNAFMNGEYFP